MTKTSSLDPEERRTLCQHPQHEPPLIPPLKPGKYEHQCPGCKTIGRFTVVSSDDAPLTKPPKTVRGGVW